ncbi:MAG TPA: class I SAM-dependent methyltransferase [Mycobacteriales bacterium]|nr:class I SAM-dependent methyltransferase [Mycobacteriales bacterium]
MVTRQERAQSFGSVATSYDRLRPAPAPGALDWLVPSGCTVAVDLAAGTGLFTRPLAERVPRVIAVEPDPKMRSVLALRSPGVELVEGTGEAIPLPDAGADALFVSSAWHWLDPARALPEIARVLRDGGRLGVLWTSRDRDVEWVRDLDRLPGEPPWDGEAEGRHRRRRELDLTLGGASFFTAVEQMSFPDTRRMRKDDVVEMAGTYSAVITAPPDVRRTVLGNARAALDRRFPGVAEVEFPIRSWCFRADRLAR